MNVDSTGNSASDLEPRYWHIRVRRIMFLSGRRCIYATAQLRCPVAQQ